MLSHSINRRAWISSAISITCASLAPGSIARGSGQDGASEARPPRDDDDLRTWLENMVGAHRFTVPEVQAATGLDPVAINAALKRFRIEAGKMPARGPGSPLLVLPYPGGRHPRIGFLDGAVRPQRDTKFSVFTPWDDSSYVVVDMPEAIWSNLGLTYLAHTHVPTIWTKRNITLEPQEWLQAKDGSLTSERKLPNGIQFAAQVIPKPDHAQMTLKLINGTNGRLSDLRVQQCVMLKGARGFSQQTNDNKIFEKPYVACRSDDGRRWIITAWTPCDRVWGNAPCPCLHSDPKFPDCPPGETRVLRGWLSFYEGPDIRAELRRIELTAWQADDGVARTK
jgi:hypothetical protein